MINYSLTSRVANPMLVNPAITRIKAAQAAGQEPSATDVALVENAEHKYYANSQSLESISLDEFAEHISSHNSKYCKADIYAVLILAVDCLREKLLEGVTVSFGELGSFSVTLTSTGATEAKDFKANNIKKVKVRWTPGEAFTDIRRDASFHQVLTRDNQQILLKVTNGAELSESERQQVAGIMALLQAATNENGGEGDGDGDGDDTGGGGNPQGGLQE